jgi:hypothetical protein
MKQAVNTALRELFFVLSIAIIIFVILELIWPGIVLSYINTSWVLIFWLMLGIFVVIKTGE